MDTIISIFISVISFIAAAYFYYFFRNRSEETNRLSQLLRLVNELSLEMITVTNMEKLLPFAIDAFAKVGGVNRGSLMLLNEETGLLEIHASLGLSNNQKIKKCLKVGEGISGTVAKTGNSILLKDISEDENYCKELG